MFRVIGVDGGGEATDPKRHPRYGGKDYTAQERGKLTAPAPDFKRPRTVRNPSLPSGTYLVDLQSTLTLT